MTHPCDHCGYDPHADEAMAAHDEAIIAAAHARITELEAGTQKAMNLAVAGSLARIAALEEDKAMLNRMVDASEARVAELQVALLSERTQHAEALSIAADVLYRVTALPAGGPVPDSVRNRAILALPVVRAGLLPTPRPG